MPTKQFFRYIMARTS